VNCTCSSTSVVSAWIPRAGTRAGPYFGAGAENGSNRLRATLDLKLERETFLNRLTLVAQRGDAQPRSSSITTLSGLSCAVTI
jgi:hypothetical protein